MGREGGVLVCQKSWMFFVFFCQLSVGWFVALFRTLRGVVVPGWRVWSGNEKWWEVYIETYVLSPCTTKLLCCTVLYCTTLYYSVLLCTVLYCTVVIFFVMFVLVIFVALHMIYHTRNVSFMFRLPFEYCFSLTFVFSCFCRAPLFFVYYGCLIVFLWSLFWVVFAKLPFLFFVFLMLRLPSCFFFCQVCFVCFLSRFPFLFLNVTVVAFLFSRGGFLLQPRTLRYI